MQFIFHIGMAKTGSTALQNALFQSAEYLAERGVLYPVPPELGGRNHKIFATLTGPTGKLPRHMTQLVDTRTAAARMAQVQDGIAAQVAARRPDLLLMSSETMFTTIRRGYGARLRAALTRFDAHPRFVAYLRRPSERYASGLQQHLTASATMLRPRAPNYRQHIESYERVFGKGCLSLHLFHRSALAEGDVVSDFAIRYLADHGVDPAGLVQVGEVNVGLSAESMLLMQAFRARFHAGNDDRKTRDSKQLRQYLRTADEAVGAGRPQLRPEIAERVDYASDDPLWLRDRFGIEFPDFDYARLEAKRLARAVPPPATLADIVLVDPDRLSGVLDHLAATPWGRHRAEWLAELRARHGTAAATPQPEPAPPPSRKPPHKRKSAQRRDQRERRQRPSDLDTGPTPPIERLLLIIGAMKSGTTALYRYLNQHPEVARHWIKESNFFADTKVFRHGRDYYLQGWKTFDPSRHRYAMEASPNYTKAPHDAEVPRRIAGFGLNCHFLYIVRDPVDRIESHIAHNIAHIRRRPDLTPDDPDVRHAISVSKYAYQLEQFRAGYPDAKILVLDFEELKAEPMRMMGRCVDFLGLDPSFDFTPIRPAKVRKSVNGSDSFSLGDDLRGQLREILRPDAVRFSEAYGFDIGRWGFR
jgi:hypothetical protein